MHNNNFLNDASIVITLIDIISDKHQQAKWWFKNSVTMRWDANYKQCS